LPLRVKFMLRKFKYQILLFVLLLIGGIFIQLLLNSQQESEQNRLRTELRKSHKEVVLRIETGINVYATLVSSIRSFMKNSAEFPSELQLQSYLRDLVEKIDFNDSIIISYVDTAHYFQYVITPYELDPANLKGSDVKSFRSDEEIKALDDLMKGDEILLYPPINIREGWAAFPFDFTAKDSQGEILGYIAPVLSVKSLLSYPYKAENDSLFVHRFSDARGVDFSREVVYDGTEIYNTERDPFYYKNFNVPEENFIYSDVDFYGLKLRVGTAYRSNSPPKNRFAIMTYSWYLFLCLFVAVFLFQNYRNNKLSKEVTIAYDEIAEQNSQLEQNLENTQVLIKEVHHRVKNNMQIMTSLMNLQSNDSSDEKIAAVLDVCKGRIQSMALVHEKLYSNESLATIKVRTYLQELVSFIETAFDEEDASPDKRINVSSELFLNTNTMIPLGLIVNELVTNSYKHAFGKKADEWLSIEIYQNETNFVLKYSDSGPGVPEQINHLESDSLGIELIHMLTEQLNGEVRYSNSESNTYTIEFEKIDN